MMLRDKLLAQATNPKAYDHQHTEWVVENGKNSSRQTIYREYFTPFQKDWQDKDVIDIGSGAGWLLNFFSEDGARSVKGLEPSAKNTTASKELYPNIKVVNQDLMSYKPDEKFNFASCVMVLSNLPDVRAALDKIASILTSHARLFLVVPDYDYFRSPRHDYKLTVVDLNPNEYVVETVRPTTLLTDIVRREAVYTEAAQEAGFKLLNTIPMTPTPSFQQKMTQYKNNNVQPIMRFLRFEKT